MRHTNENVSTNRTLKTRLYSSILPPQVPVWKSVFKWHHCSIL
jgi:hypothetical protein